MNDRIESSAVDGPGTCGDFARCIELAPHRRAIVVGDIAGRGTAAAEGASALCEYVCRLVVRGGPLTKTLGAASDFFGRRILAENIPFASLFIAVVDLRDGTMRYASAGHEPALLFDRDGARAHRHLAPTGPILGLGPTLAFRESTMPLFDESLLVVVTDGITDARRRAGDRFSFFGTAGVARAVADAVRQRRDPAQDVYSAAVRHAGGDLGDDACVVVSSLSLEHDAAPWTGDGAHVVAAHL